MKTKTIKILSWNLYNFYDYDYFIKEGFVKDIGESKNFIAQRLDYFTKKIKEINPDISYFYEIGDVDLLKKMYGNIFPEFCIFETTPDRRGIRNVILSKEKLKNEEVFLTDLEIPNFVIDETPYINKYLVQKRGYIKTSINDLNIYAVHLKSQIASRIKIQSGEDYEVKNSVEYARSEILGELIGLAESYGVRKIFSEDINNKKSVIAIGDFNADSYSKRLKILRGLRDSDDEMIDIFKVEDSEYYSHVYRGNKVRLDHAIASKDIIDKIENASMEKDLIGVADGLAFIDMKIVGSDHAPIVFDIEL